MVDSVEMLRAMKCKVCLPDTAPLSAERIQSLLMLLNGWALEDGYIRRTFAFSNYHETIAFVNASAWISHREDHHPDLAVGFNQCKVSYATHSIGGLSCNDFICAAKLDALVEDRG